MEVMSRRVKKCPYQWVEMDIIKPKNKKHTNFTIENILKNNDDQGAGDREKQNKEEEYSIEEEEEEEKQNEFNKDYDWLRCTRYKPPKLQRNRKRDGNLKRRCGRNPRIPFSGDQVSLLEDKFRECAYLSNTDVARISSILQLSESRIKIWFQNRRARERREKQDRNNKDHPGISSVKSFIEKTRYANSNDEDCQHVQDLSLSAFSLCKVIQK